MDALVWFTPRSPEAFPMQLASPKAGHLLGIDIGSTVLKAVLFDLRGRVIAQAHAPVTVQRPRPDWVERDAEKTWRVAAAVLRRTVPAHAAEIVAIGVTGCGNGAVFLDHRQRPLRAGILSSDTRATEFMPRPGGRLGQVPYPGQLPALLAWFRANEPRVARRLAHAFFWKDFIRARLTGLVVSDFTDPGAAGLLRYPKRSWRRPDPAWPDLQESLGQAGEISRPAARATGLRAGTPVFTGCIDCEAAAIGSGVGRLGEVSVVAGTWSINQTYAARPPRRRRHFLVNPAVVPGRWLVLEGSPASAANFDWAVRTFGDGLRAAQAAAEAASAPRSGLLFVPHVPTGQGAFLGLSSDHQRGHLFRAVMEGVIFAHRAHLEKLRAGTGWIERVTLSGGAAASPFWCQLFADGLGCKVEVPRGDQLGALGAAICAGVGAGLWPDIPAAQKAMGPGKRVFSPNRQQHAALSHDYARYRRHVCSLTP